jgi:hypothetical protein
MSKQPPALVIVVAAAVLGGCVRVHVEPVPPAPARASTDIRGVVLARAGEAERVEFERVDRVEWTDSTVIVTGVRRRRTEAETTAHPGAAGTATTHSFALATVSGVLVKGIDPNRTSFIVAAIALGGVVIATLLIEGETDESTVVRGLRK